MKKKQIGILAISIIVIGLMISISGAAMFQNSIDEEKTLVFEKHKKIDFNVDIAKAKTPTKISPSDTIHSLDIPAFDGITPAVSHSGSTMAGASYNWDQANVYHYFSLDNGETWDGGLGWDLSDSPELPSIDGCGDGRYISSFVPNPYSDDGSAMFKTTFAANDFENTFDGSYWTWNDVGDGYVYFIDMEVAGYTSSVPDENTWAYGAHGFIGDDLGGGYSQTPLYSYQCTEDGTAWIYNLGNFSGSESCGIDIDQGTNFCYAVYNYDNYNDVQGDFNLYILKMNMNTWGDFSGYPIHEESYDIFLNSSGNDNVVDISSFNENVIIVSERDGAIISYYSDDGLNNIGEVQIDSSGVQPRIVHIGDDYAVCSFIKDGALYTSITEDGGVTWTSPNENSEEGPVFSGDICAFGAMYEAEEIIYFSPIQASFPIIEIDSISGGIGVNAVIKNTGTGDAIDIPYTMSATGGILGKINENIDGELSISAGSSSTISLPMLIGLGAVTIEINAGTAIETIQGTQLIVYTKI